MDKKLLNKKYTLELEVLTPLHVGTGSEKDWMKGADYIQDKEKLYVLNHKKLAQKISPDALAGFLINKDDTGLKNKISGMLDEVSDVVFSAPVHSNNDIKTFLKNGLTNKPIVPGSSIKGAVRSILLKEFLNGEKSFDDQRIFGNPNNGDAFMRFIKISDGEFDKTVLMNTKVFNLYKNGSYFSGGWKHEFRGNTNGTFKPDGFNTIYEVLAPGASGEITLALSYVGFNNLEKKDIIPSYKEEKKLILNQDVTKKLFAIINRHSKEYIEKQIAFFEKYKTDKTDKIVESLENVKNQIPDDNFCCILKMSAGSGFHSITGDWQFDDFSIDSVDDKNWQGRGHIAKKDGKKSAKSRKIAIDDEHFYLMGFVKLTKLTDERIAERENARKAKMKAEREEKEQIEAEKRAKEEAEGKRLRIEREEKERIEAEKRAKAKAAKEAIKKLLKTIEKEEERRRLENEQKIKAGLSVLSKEQDYNKGKNLIDKYKKKNGKIEESQIPFIKAFVEKYFNATEKEWKNFKRGKRWKEISGWVGKETAQQWFDEKR